MHWCCENKTVAFSNQGENSFSVSLSFIVNGAIIIFIKKKGSQGMCVFVAYIFSFIQYVKYIVTITPTRIDNFKPALDKNLNINICLLYYPFIS